MESPISVERLKDLTKILKLKPIFVSVVHPNQEIDTNQLEPVLVIEHQVQSLTELKREARIKSILYPLLKTKINVSELL